MSNLCYPIQGGGHGHSAFSSCANRLRTDSHGPFFATTYNHCLVIVAKTALRVYGQAR